jgi:hypothetical protein
MKSELMALIEGGMSYEKAGAQFGLTRGMVAGIVYRVRHPDADHMRRKLDSAKHLWTEARLTEKWEHRKLRRQREAANGQAAG